ncbi:RNA-directed DNA polymerase from mobile element jockey [Trichonephila clavipes]|nr:RNA-directed DNA polymerase from mobile element jockey [Trichonephila clavipes]
MAFLGKARKQDLVLLAEELGQKVSDKMTIIDLKNIIIGSKDYEEEFVRAQLSVILEERVERETEEKIARQLCYESELNELRLQIESIRSNVKRTSCAEDRKNTSSNYRISIGRAGEHMRETSPAVLMAEATIPVTTPIKEENGMDDLRVVYVKVKGEQEMANAVMDTGAQMPVVRPDVVEGQSIDNRGSIQITSAFGEHEMGEVKDSNMELNDLRHGVVPVSKNLVNDMLICSSDYEVLIENTQMIRNPAKLREPSKKEGIISSTDSKSVCSQEVVTDLLPETQSLLNVPNGDLVAVKINGSNVQTNGQGIKESKGEVVLTCGFKKGILYSTRRGCPPRLNDHLERENILIPEQHGFRPRLSTSHQLLRVVEFIKEGNNKDECTAAVFLDIQKAFDRVWHTGLLFKLITYKIPPPLIYLLNSYISDRSFTVKINRTFSQLKKINAGVAQGSILAPTLFNLYVNDIIKHSNTIICMYADDTAILSRHRNLDTLVENINEHLAHLETWFSVWKIALNSSKTEAVFFSKRKPPLKLLYKIKEYPGLNTPSILV